MVHESINQVLISTGRNTKSPIFYDPIDLEPVVGQYEAITIQMHLILLTNPQVERFAR